MFIIFCCYVFLHCLSLSSLCVHSVVAVQNVPVSAGQYVALQRPDVIAVHLGTHLKGLDTNKIVWLLYRAICPANMQILGWLGINENLIIASSLTAPAEGFSHSSIPCKCVCEYKWMFFSLWPWDEVADCPLDCHSTCCFWPLTTGKHSCDPGVLYSPPTLRNKESAAFAWLKVGKSGGLPNPNQVASCRTSHRLQEISSVPPVKSGSFPRLLVEKITKVALQPWLSSWQQSGNS